jgi:hypothetical protein
MALSRTQSCPGPWPCVPSPVMMIRIWQLPRPRVGRRGSVLAATVLLIVAWTTTGCTQQDLRYQPSVGVTDMSQDVHALSLTVVTDNAGTATLVGTLLNQGSQADSLVRVSATSSSPAGHPVTAGLGHGPVALPVGQPVQLAPISAVTLTSESFPAGDTLDMTLAFSRSGQIDLLVVVFPQDGVFGDVEVARAA